MAVVPEPVLRRLDPEARYGLRLTLYGLAMVLVAVPFSYLLFEVIRKGPFTRFDQSAARDLHVRVLGHPQLIHALNLISWLGKPLLLGICIAVGAVFVFVRGRRRLAIFLAVTAIGGGLVDSAVKILVNRPRPELESPIASAFGKSFPSGHAMSSTVTYGALLLVFLPVIHRRWRPLAYALVIGLVGAICMARLLLGVHFVSDVLGGLALGLAWLAGSAAMFNIWREERGRPKAHVATKGLEPEAGHDLTVPADRTDEPSTV